LVAAFAAALGISLSWKPASYVEQLIRIQAEQELGGVDPRIRDEPVQVQAMLLDYAGDRELALKAWIALAKYQGSARDILVRYGSEPEFKDILRTYGDTVIPVIQYFRDNDVWSVSAMDATAKAVDAVKEWWKQVTENGPASPGPAALPKPVPLGPDERGWYAVHFIKHEGHNFLAQFAVNKDKKAVWNQTDRIVKASTAFFTSGVRNLEAKHDLGENITAMDAFWAGLDVALVALPAKLLISGKAVARSGGELNLATRTRLFAPRLVSGSQAFKRFGAYGAMAATVYIVVTNPSLLNSVFAEVADLIGVSPWVVQVAGWSILIAVALFVLSWLLVPAAQLTLFLLKRPARSRRWS